MSHLGQKFQEKLHLLLVQDEATQVNAWPPGLRWLTLL